jgi:ABC-type transport system substrate-binding protein
MGRVQLIFSAIGAVLVGILLLRALLSFAQPGPRRRKSSNVDALDLNMSDEDVGAESSQPGQYENFAQLLERFVLPRHAANPGWDRLDGAYGVPGRPLAWFDWNGTRYGINGETHFAPLLLASEWMREHPDKDPLVVQATKGKAGRVTLRPEVGWTDLKAVRIETG